MRTEIEALKEIRDRISYFCSRTDGKYDPPWAQEVIGIIDDVLITPYRQCKRFSAPFYVEVGTSIVAIRCASNHDVVWWADHSVHGKSTVDWAESVCTRMNQEAHKRECGESVTGSNQLRDALDKARRFIDSSPLMSIVDDTGTIVRGELCAEIDAALAAPATAEKSSAVGDSAKLREALEFCVKGMCGYCRMDAEARGMTTECVHGCEALLMAKAALAAPPRNCDRPECATTTAAQDVWRREDGGKTAYYEWLLATYKKGDNDGNK